MSRPTYAPRQDYIGNGALNVYSFNFKITDLSQIIIVQCTVGFAAETFNVRGTDTTYLTSVVFDPEAGGGVVTLVANVPNNHRLIVLLADDAPKQISEYRNKSDFTLRRFENSLDYVSGGIQRAAYLLTRAFRFKDSADLTGFDTTLPKPVADNVLAINSDGTGFTYIPKATLASAAGGGVPPGGLENDVLQRDAAVSTAKWVTYAIAGFSSRFGTIVNIATLQDAIAYIFAITYSPPTISLSASGSGTVREKGATVSSTTLSASITKRSNPIANGRFYQGATLLDTETGNPPVPAGGNINYNYSTPFSDNISFTAQTVDTLVGTDGPTNVVSNTVSFTFVYPYYYGAGAAGLSGAAIAALTKQIIVSSSTVNETIAVNGTQKMYFAYPAAYGDLTQILDVNNFDVTPDWTKSTKSITGLDGNAVSYTCYEFNNTAVAGSYFFSFRR